MRGATSRAIQWKRMSRRFRNGAARRLHNRRSLQRNRPARPTSGAMQRRPSPRSPAKLPGAPHERRGVTPAQPRASLSIEQRSRGRAGCLSLSQITYSDKSIEDERPANRQARSRAAFRPQETIWKSDLTGSRRANASFRDAETAESDTPRRAWGCFRPLRDVKRRGARSDGAGHRPWGRR